MTARRTATSITDDELAALYDERDLLIHERDLLRRLTARHADVLANFAAFAFGRGDSRRRLLRQKWLTADRVLASLSGPAQGCDCAGTLLRHMSECGHLVTCPNTWTTRDRRRHYGRQADR
jgi:hypothetical protein